MADDDHRLLTLQLAWEKELANQHLKLVGLSVNDFISELLVAGLNKRAEKVRADWKVSDKRSARPCFGKVKLTSCIGFGGSN